MLYRKQEKAYFIISGVALQRWAFIYLFCILPLGAYLVWLNVETEPKDIRYCRDVCHSLRRHIRQGLGSMQKLGFIRNHIMT